MSKDRDELAGLTAQACAAGCKRGRCVITENQFCGHPFKCSHADAGPKVLERMTRARKMIAMQKIEAA
jgi:hypothetical protein